MHSTFSLRSKVRAWSYYAALGFIAVTVTIVGVSLKGLAARAHVDSPEDLHSIFIGRLCGAPFGTLLAGALADLLPMKALMITFMTMSVCSLFAIPFVASFGLGALMIDFGVLGFAGSALVTCATTAACWAFPGERVGPVMSGLSAAFGVTSASLPVLLISAHGVLEIQYALAAVLVLPAAILLCVSEPPVKPGKLGVARQASAESNKNWKNWLVAFLAAIAQLFLQSANAGLLVWLPSFGEQELHLPASKASMFVTALQSSATLGSLVAMNYQQQFALLNLACVQLSLVVVILVVWVSFLSSAMVGFCAVASFGFIGGSTLGYPSALFNKYTTPSGKQTSLITMGSNAGVSLGPFMIGIGMKYVGPSAVSGLVVLANATVLLGLLGIKLCMSSNMSGAAKAREIVPEDAKTKPHLAAKLLEAGLR